MGIALIVVGGIVLVSVVASYFDYLGKKAKSSNPDLAARLGELENRLKVLEVAQIEKDEKIERLSSELGFVNKLLDKR